MDDRCASTDRQKRNTESQGLVLRLPDSTAIRNKRQSDDSLLSALQEEVICLTNLLSSQRPENLTTSLCMNATIAAPCDNTAVVNR